jgi:DNA recombination protein RmuC
MDTILFFVGDFPITLLHAALAAAALFVLLLTPIVLGIRQNKALRREAEEQAERQNRADEQINALLRAQMELFGRLQGVGDVLSNKQSELAKAVSDRLDNVTQRVGENLTTGAQATAEQLQKLEARLSVIDAAQKNIGSLSEQVTSLTSILANKQARGAFGQGQMEAIIKDALPASGYSFQATLSSRLRPDCLIFLPGDRRGLVVDAKFPLEAFEMLRRSTDEASERQAAARMRADMITHIQAVKQYLIPEETQEVALLFVPSEALHAELHERFEDVVQRAHKARVLIVSPSLLMLSIHVVKALMRDAAMREQAHLIQKEVGLLIEDVARLADRSNNLKRHMAMTEKDLREIETSAEKIAARGQRIDRMDFDGPTAEGQTLIARIEPEPVRGYQGDLLRGPLIPDEAAE